MNTGSCGIDGGATNQELLPAILPASATFRGSVGTADAKTRANASRLPMKILGSAGIRIIRHSWILPRIDRQPGRGRATKKPHEAAFLR